MAQWRVSVTAASHWAVFIRYGNNPRPRSTSFIAGTAADCLRLGGSIECIVRTPAKNKPIGSEKRADKFNWHRGGPKMFATIQIDDRLGRFLVLNRNFAGISFARSWGRVILPRHD
jgi:hypothetical protein